MSVMSVQELPSKTARVDAANLLCSGSAERPAASRAGYVPIPLEQLLIPALRDLPVYLRTGTDSARRYILYTSESIRFTDRHRERLQDAGVRFIYIAMNQHTKFRHQVEEELVATVTNPALALSTKTALVYETSLELINDILGEQGLAKNLPRLDALARAVSTLVVNDGEAFGHLFATAQHDFYTATHMVNVGTWMTALACALGENDPAKLNAICTAGMLHDVGKMFVPEAVLNKRGELTDGDWKTLRDHPQRGARHLKQEGITCEVVLRVTLEHHERINGEGYPLHLKGDHIHPMAQVCAVVDSFDAMTACRPYKNSVKTIGEAAAILQHEAGQRYAPEIVNTWLDLLRDSYHETIGEPFDTNTDKPGRRTHERFGIDCPLRVHALTPAAARGKGWEESKPANGKAHNLSRTGLGFLTQIPVKPGTYIRAYLKGSGTLENLVLEGQTVRCRAYKDGWHEVGVKLCTPGVQEAASAAVVIRDK